MNAVIADAGILYAAADKDDPWHSKAKAFLETNTDPLIVPETVIPEVCYFLNRRLGAQAERQFVFSLVRGELRIESLLKEDIRRSLQLLDQFIKANIGFGDASIVSIAERLKITRILTTDRKHFSLFLPRHCSAFTVLP